MNTEKLSAFKSRLQEELRQIESELKNVGVQNPSNPHDWEAKETSLDVMNSPADANEAADKMEEYTSNRAITETLEIRFNSIQRALEKIDDGTYGICEIGGEEIEEERLLANPSARTCLSHKDQDSSLAQ